MRWSYFGRFNMQPGFPSSCMCSLMLIPGVSDCPVIRHRFVPLARQPYRGLGVCHGVDWLHPILLTPCGGAQKAEADLQSLLTTPSTRLTLHRQYVHLLSLQHRHVADNLQKVSVHPWVHDEPVRPGPHGGSLGLEALHGACLVSVSSMHIVVYIRFPLSCHWEAWKRPTQQVILRSVASAALIHRVSSKTACQQHICMRMYTADCLPGPPVR